VKKHIVIHLKDLYGGSSGAKLARTDDVYVEKALELAGEGNDIVLTGAGPVWLYLKIAHALHGRARKLMYRSPVTGDILIFDHSID
jgi:hypothetical protein